MKLLYNHLLSVGMEKLKAYIPSEKQQMVRVPILPTDPDDEALVDKLVNEKMGSQKVRKMLTEEDVRSIVNQELDKRLGIKE